MPDDPAKPEIDAGQVGLAQLRDDISALARTIVGLTAKHIPSDLHGVDAVDDTVRNAGAALKSIGAEAFAGLEKRIVERPVTAVLAAFGVGLLLGKLTDRS